jgi:ribulose-bisphosphate carboxylase large chain
MPPLSRPPPAPAATPAAATGGSATAAPPRIVARYRVETAFPLEAAAAALAGEQSAGTFVRVEGETDELIARHGARVETILDQGEVPLPSLPGAKRPVPNATIRTAEVTLSFPPENIGTALPNLFTMLAGNLFELQAFSGVRLLDFEVPAAFAAAQPGPQFGIAGTRALTGVTDGPLLGTIVKPSVGLTPDQTAALVDRLVSAGLDFIKDDELIASPPYSPLPARVAAVMPVLQRHADRTGRLAMYAFNITDSPDALLRHHDTVAAAGGTCVMVNLIPAGLTGLLHLRRHSRLAIHGHRSGWGMWSRCPALGMDYAAAQKFWRFAGADHLHVNGLRNKFCEPDASVIASARACQTPIHGRHAVMPVFSSGQTVAQVPDTLRALGNTDLLYLAGGGVLGHPMGATAGVGALRAAWAAARAGESLATAAERAPELRVALEFFRR